MASKNALSRDACLSMLLGLSVLSGLASGQRLDTQDVGAPTNQGALTIQVAPFEPEPHQDEKHPSGTYKTGEKIRFRILATNNSTETIHVKIMTPHDAMRPELRANGHLVKYVEKVDGLLERKSSLADGIRMTFVQLLPGETKRIGIVDLREWYEPLDAGLYELTVNQRVRDGWIQSPTLGFEIVERLP